MNTLRSRLALLFAACTAYLPASGQYGPTLTWITNSSVKLEQNIGDVDWATGSNATSRTISRFNIVGTDLGYSFVSGTNLIFLFGDTIGSNVSYHAADTLAWSTTTNGEQGLLLNFFTNSVGSNVFINPNGIDMSGDDTPNAGITISNVTYIICNTGADHGNPTNNHWSAYSVLVTFDQTNLSFQTNRAISFTTNGGHFVFNSLHLDGTNVLMFGEGNYRNSDIYLATVPASSFLSGDGTLYFAGLTNGQPAWKTVETNAVPVVQDNPTNGPPWPSDSPSVGKVSVIYSAGLRLWLMTYDGGRNTLDKPDTVGIYFSCAAQPWGPWSTPQLIFNPTRDGGFGEFIHNNKYNPTGPDGPTINPSQNNPTNTDGVVYAPYLIEPFTTISNGMLFIYYVMSTWNPYTNVKMRSAFAIQPVIDPASLAHKKGKFSFSWDGPTNGSYQVDYSSNLLSGWATFTNIITSTNGTFNFSDNGTNSSVPGASRFYRVRTAL